MSTASRLVESVLDLDSQLRLSSQSAGLLMTPEEFRGVTDVDESFRYELVHNVCVVHPAPSVNERLPNGTLGHWLRMYGDSHPRDFSLNETVFGQEVRTLHGICRPDRVIWAGLGRFPEIDRDPPTIVIEFVSKTSRDRRRDYEQKREEYAEIGVAEYWIIDRFRRTMTVCRGSEVPMIVRETQTFTTERLPGFELPLGKLLAIADRYVDK